MTAEYRAATTNFDHSYSRAALVLSLDRRGGAGLLKSRSNTTRPRRRQCAASEEHAHVISNPLICYRHVYSIFWKALPSLATARLCNATISGTSVTSPQAI